MSGAPIHVASDTFHRALRIEMSVLSQRTVPSNTLAMPSIQVCKHRFMCAGDYECINLSRFLARDTQQFIAVM